MAETIKMQGLAEVRKALRAMPREMAKKELMKALRPGAKLVVATAKALAPSSGKTLHRMLRGKEWNKKAFNLKDSIDMRSEKKALLRNSAKIRIGVLHSNRDPNVGAWYWRFVEFGTKRMGAQPFLTPAFELTKYTVNKLIKDSLLQGVRRAAAKVKAPERKG